MAWRDRNVMAPDQEYVVEAAEFPTSASATRPLSWPKCEVLLRHAEPSIHRSIVLISFVWWLHTQYLSLSSFVSGEGNSYSRRLLQYHNTVAKVSFSYGSIWIFCSGWMRIFPNYGVSLLWDELVRTCFIFCNDAFCKWLSFTLETAKMLKWSSHSFAFALLGEYFQNSVSRHFTKIKSEMISWTGPFTVPTISAISQTLSFWPYLSKPSKMKIIFISAQGP
jgi:hypothetical protein